MRPWCFEPVFASHSGAWVSWTCESWLVCKNSWFAVRCPMWTVVKSSCGWAVKGFPCTKGRLEQQPVKHMYGVVMEFLLPQLNFRERVARRTTGGLLYMRRVGQTRVNNPQLSSQEQKKASRIVSRRSWMNWRKRSCAQKSFRCFRSVWHFANKALAGATTTGGGTTGYELSHRHKNARKGRGLQRRTKWVRWLVLCVESLCCVCKP